MKPLHVALSLAAATLTAFAAVSADSSSQTIPLRFLQAAEVYDGIKHHLGPAAASAVLGLDLRANTVSLETDHPEAAKVRELISKLDTRPPAVRVTATIKRIIPATPTAEAGEEILARPTVLGAYGQPMILSVGDPEHGMIQIEVQVTPIPGESK